MRAVVTSGTGTALAGQTWVITGTLPTLSRKQATELVEGAVAEPVVYMIDRFVVGGFYRVHNERGVDENLNAPGMQFHPLAFEDPCLPPDCKGAPNRFYTYGVVARLAMLAAARELEAMR